MELEQFAADLDWEDDIEASLADDDFDSEIEIEPNSRSAATR
jgi:hypothetical protein